MGVLTGFSRTLGHQKWFAAVGRTVAVPVDRLLFRATGGKVSLLSATGIPPLSLITTGRKTGQPRMVSLLYARHGDDYVVTASNWGQPNHPAWSGNLLAQPDATVNIGGTEIPVRARLVTGTERAEVWRTVTAVWPAYDTYAARADNREIRVFLLTPR